MLKVSRTVDCATIVTFHVRVDC